MVDEMNEMVDEMNGMDFGLWTQQRWCGDKM